MKIRHKLTLRYTGITAGVFSLSLLLIYLFSGQNRKEDFFRYLTQEAVTKANIFLNQHADATTMQSIYRNNRQFIDEVELAIYTTDYKLIYHDAQDVDIIKETPDLIQKTIAEGNLHFYEGNYQGITMIYHYKNSDYMLSAAAYDGHGYTMLQHLAALLIVLWLCGLVLIMVLGYLLARSTLSPVSDIVDRMDAISENNLNTRLIVKEKHDELDELSDTFNHMLDRLEQSFTNHKMFVSHIAHELRTPLAALIAELELALLRNERTVEEYKTSISNSLDDAKSIKQLINGLLDLARANYDPSQIVKENLRLDELLLDARGTVIKANPKYLIELIFDQYIDDESLITVRANEYLLKIAFINLMENNCKFSDNNTSIVQISFFEKNSIIRFSDTGIGIPIEEINAIFDPFYRASNSKHIKGQGIGMALAYKIISLHHGCISVLSNKDEGTCFVVEIPHI